MNSKLAALLWFFMTLQMAPYGPYFSIAVAAIVAHAIMAIIDILELCDLNYADVSVIVAVCLYVKMNGIIHKYLTSYARDQ